MLISLNAPSTAGKFEEEEQDACDYTHPYWSETRIHTAKPENPPIDLWAHWIVESILYKWHFHNLPHVLISIFWTYYLLPLSH